MKINNFRLRAFLIHLVSSVFAAGVSLFIVFVIWHPAPLAKAVGVTYIFIMMLGIDMVLGPLLTLIVAKKGKKSLKFDLSVIIILQVAAFVYGIYNIAVSRPVYIAFDSIRFEVVQANEISKSSLEQAQSPYQILGWGTPKYVAVKAAKNDEERSDRLFSELKTGIAPSKQPNLYEPLDNQWSIISSEAKSLTNLYNNNPKLSVDNAIDNHPSATGWLPLLAYQQDMVVLINSESDQIVDIVDLRP